MTIMEFQVSLTTPTKCTHVYVIVLLVVLTEQTVFNHRFPYTATRKRTPTRALEWRNLRRSQRYMGVYEANSKRRGDECCRRFSKTLLAGFDVDGVPFTVDVGQCRKSCSSRVANIVKGKVSPYCSHSSACKPSRVRQEVYHLVGGPVRHEVITECRCGRKTGTCERSSKITVLRPGTPFQTEVDVGDCSGRCRKGNGCKPQRNRTVTVPGPNGAECVQVVEECACASQCYRVSKTDVYVERTTDRKESERHVDVGQCMGDCSEAETYQCVFRSKAMSGRGPACLMSLKKRATSCIPLTYNTHKFRGLDERNNTVLAIRTCGCS